VGRIPTTVAGFRERRLASLLVAGVPGAAREDLVAELFALTLRQAQGLLAGARARFRRELRGPLTAAVGESIGGEDRSGALEGGRVWFRAPTSAVAMMRELLASAEGRYTPISADRDTAGTYTTHRDTLRYVCAELGIPEAGVVALRDQ
jgi:hypothetical protein